MTYSYDRVRTGRRIQARRMALELTPFAGMQNLPLRAYSGELAGAALLRAAGLQAFWLAALVALGILLMSAALRRVVVQGG